MPLDLHDWVFVGEVQKRVSEMAGRYEKAIAQQKRNIQQLQEQLTETSNAYHQAIADYNGLVQQYNELRKTNAANVSALEETRAQLVQEHERAESLQEELNVTKERAAKVVGELGSALRKLESHGEVANKVVTELGETKQQLNSYVASYAASVSMLSYLGAYFEDDKCEDMQGFYVSSNMQSMDPAQVWESARERYRNTLADLGEDGPDTAVPWRMPHALADDEDASADPSSAVLR